MAWADSTEVPVRGTVVVPALLWMISDPDSAPLLCVGLKATATPQLAPGLRTLPQAELELSVCKVTAKSPLASMLFKVTGEFPGLLTTSSSLTLVEPSTCDPNARDDWPNTSDPVAWIPVPVRLKTDGVPEDATVSVNVPVRVPVAVGSNATLTEQLACGPNLVPPQLPPSTTAKSPVVNVRSIATKSSPGLVIVNVCAALGSPTG
jgi:hypothetical protein